MTLNFGQTLFPPTSDPQITFAFSDVARRTGYLEYHVVLDSNGNYKAIPNADFTSALQATSGYANLDTEAIEGTDMYQKVDINIDLTFTNALNLDGEMYFNMPISIVNHAITEKYLGRLSAFHYDGSTETAIGSLQQTPVYTNDTDSSANYGGAPSSVSNTLTVNTAGTVHFKAGEILRIKAEIWTSLSANDTHPGGIGHDPNGNAPSYYFPTDTLAIGGGDFKWLLPMKIDI